MHLGWPGKAWSPIGLHGYLQSFEAPIQQICSVDLLDNRSPIRKIVRDALAGTMGVEQLYVARGLII